MLGAAVDDLYEMGRFETAIATGKRLTRKLSRCGCGDPASRLARDRSLGVRNRGLRTGRTRLRTSSGAHRRKTTSRARASSTTWRHRSTSRANWRAAPKITGRPQITSCGSPRQRRRPRFGLQPSSMRVQPSFGSRLGPKPSRSWMRSARAIPITSCAAKPRSSWLRCTNSRESRSERRSSTSASRPRPRATSSVRKRCWSPANSIEQAAANGSRDQGLSILSRAVPRTPRGRDRNTLQDRRTPWRRAEITAGQHAELERIVASDRRAGDQRSDRIRYLAARSALVLTEGAYDRFAAIELTQPFERSLGAEAASDGRGIDGIWISRRLRSRRGDRGSHLLHGRDLPRLQRVVARLGAAERSRRQRSARLRARSRGRSVSPSRRRRSRFTRRTSS